MQEQRLGAVHAILIDGRRAITTEHQQATPTYSPSLDGPAEPKCECHPEHAMAAPTLLLSDDQPLHRDAVSTA